MTRDKSCGAKIYDKITQAEKLLQIGEDISKRYGIPIINKRIAVTPISLVGESCEHAIMCFWQRHGPSGREWG